MNEPFLQSYETIRHEQAAGTEVPGILDDPFAAGKPGVALCAVSRDPARTRGSLMPTANTFSQRPHYGPYDDETHDNWSMPVFRIGGTQIHVTYSVFVAMAVLTAIIASATPREGNADLPLVTLIGVAFWVGGWIVQTVGALAMGSWMRCTPASLTIGPWGVEATPRPWTASQSLAMIAATLMPVLILATVILSIDYVLMGRAGIHGAENITLWVRNWVTAWTVPSLGLTSADSPLQTGGWLCLVQVCCQTVPFPTTLGRLGLISTVSLTHRNSDPKVQARRARFAVRIIAFAVTLLAAVMLLIDEPSFPMQWPLILLLGLVLWLTAQANDIGRYVSNFHELSDEQILHWLESDDDDENVIFESTDDVIPESESIYSRLTGFARSWNHRRKALRALQRERAEADDIKQLDEVLDRLHQQGHDSLSEKDRALLTRVSQTLQKHRSES